MKWFFALLILAIVVSSIVIALSPHQEFPPEDL